MAYFFNPASASLLVQAAGALLLAALTIALLRTIRLTSLRYWSIGWVTLCVSLQGLYVASYPGFSQSSIIRYVGIVVYLLGEYVFGYMVIAGCRNLAEGIRARRSDLWLLVPTTAWCLWLDALAGGNFNLLLAVHTCIYPYLFFSALRALRRAKRASHATIGVRVMKLALFLLTIDYLHYAPLFATSEFQNKLLFAAYLAYAPLYDLLFQIMLMFGMIMAATGQVQMDRELANADQKQARDRNHPTSPLEP
jgi:hypothetical protein